MTSPTAVDPSAHMDGAFAPGHSFDWSSYPAPNLSPANTPSNARCDSHRQQGMQGTLTVK